MRKDVVFIVPIRSPPMGRDAMREAGTLIRALQEGEKLRTRATPKENIKRAKTRLKLYRD